ncbi:MAG: protein kinase [Oscillospiraceae bacterium]|nr:protein kinase [Ruminococcus sp.]MCD8345531.1 protein kinase [Oscillospiraceae bacterium]
MDDGYLPKGYTLGNGKNHYEIIDVVDHDSATITYKALCLETGTNVKVIEDYIYYGLNRNEDGSVEVPQKIKGLYPKGIENFLDKANKLLKLPKLSGVENVLSVFKANNTAYIVTDYIEGKSLKDCILHDKHVFSAEEILPKFEELMDDIQKVHEAGILHEDINPGAIILTESGKLVLRDFSLMNVTKEIEIPTFRTPGFDAVEAYMDHGHGPYTDVYSLAATIYYCLTGKVPPNAMSRLDAPDPLVPPNDLGAGLKDYQQAAILRALSVPPPTAKTPGKNPRYKTMAEFKDALQGKNKLKNMIKRRVWKK